MAAATLLGLAPSGGAFDAKTKPRFAYEASKEERIVARLYGFEGDDRTVRVAAEIYPITVRESEPQWIFHDFPAHDHARRFTDETLVALEYIGCTITDLGHSGTPPDPITPERLHAL